LLFIETLIILLAIGFWFYGGSRNRKIFRRMLPAELPEWVQEGIISEEQSGKLSKRYQLDNLARESQATLVNGIYLFGAVLIACGIVAFVAAHWDVIPKYFKLTLLVTVMVAVQAGGYYIWKIRKSSPMLGHALVLLGALIFAANIGLIAQMYHLQTDYYYGFLVWAVGTLALAYATRSVPLACLAGIASYYWLWGFHFDRQEGGFLYLLLLPALFYPFIFVNKSRGMHFILLLLWGAAIPTVLTSVGDYSTAQWPVIGSVLAALAYWAFPEWPVLQNHRELIREDSRLLGLLSLSGIAYFFSFRETVKYFIKELTPLLGEPLITKVIILLLVLLAFGSLANYFWRQRQQLLPRIESLLLLVVVLSLLALSFLNPSMYIWGTILANLAVLILGGYLVWWGLQRLDRRFFWLGMLLLVAEVAGRFFEYDTGLLLKSLVFICAGVAVILGGVWFEKRRLRQVIQDV
jgi:uncharacterized membrane protein